MPTSEELERLEEELEPLRKKLEDAMRLPEDEPVKTDTPAKPDTDFGSATWWLNAPENELITLVLRLYKAGKISLNQSLNFFINLKGTRVIPSFVPFNDELREEFE